MTAAVVVVAALSMPATGFSQRSQAQRPPELPRVIAREREGPRRIVRPQARSIPQESDLERRGRDDWQAAIDDLQERIRAVEAEDYNSAELIDSFTALGSLYQENREHLLAAAAQQRALELVRINRGLHSIDQAPLLRQLIRSAEALGDVEAAWNVEQELLTLVGRHRADIRSARILRETADRRMEVLERYDAGEFPPEIVLGCYYAPIVWGGAAADDRRCSAGSRRTVKRRLLFEAQTYYEQSINILLENEQYGSDEVPAMLMELVHSSYLYNTPGPGARSLRYLLAYQTTNAAPWLARIGTLVQIADWQLLHSRGRTAYEEALATYAEAYNLLEQHDIEQSSVDAIFAPGTPIVLPAFLPNPLLAETTAGATRYIDVAFEITRYGEARRVQILDTTTNSTRAAERRLVERILRSRFRPRGTNGRFADSERIVVRYHMND